MSAQRRRKAPSQPAGRRRPAKGRDFWGVDDTDEAIVEPIIPTDDPAAMIRSLGPAPVPGHERAAEQYFDAVYEKAVALAVALATANGLLEAVAEEE